MLTNPLHIMSRSAPGMNLVNLILCGILDGWMGTIALELRGKSTLGVAMYKCTNLLRQARAGSYLQISLLVKYIRDTGQMT